MIYEGMTIKLIKILHVENYPPHFISLSCWKTGKTRKSVQKSLNRFLCLLLLLGQRLHWGWQKEWIYQWETLQGRRSLTTMSEEGAVKDEYKDQSNWQKG